MRNPIPALVAIVALACAAPAGAAQTYTCVLPAGPGGEAMEVVLSAEAGGCPGPGIAVPRDWIVGEPRVIGAVEQAGGQSAVAGGRSATPRPAASPELVYAVSPGDPNAVAAAPAPAVGLSPPAAPGLSPAAGTAPATAAAGLSPEASGQTSGLADRGSSFPAMLIALLALAAGAAVAIGRRSPAPRPA